MRSFFWWVSLSTHFKKTVQIIRTVRNTNRLGSFNVCPFIHLFHTGINTDCISLLIHWQMNRRKHYSFSLIISIRGLCCKQSPPMLFQGVLVERDRCGWGCCNKHTHDLLHAQAVNVPKPHWLVVVTGMPTSPSHECIVLVTSKTVCEA